MLGGFSCMFVFADEIPVSSCTDTSLCGSTPASFRLLLDFVDDMLSAIHTVGTASPYLGEYVHPNRFVGETFTPPASSLLSGAKNTLTSATTFGVATAALFSSPLKLSSIKAFVWGIFMSTQNKLFLRDQKLVESLESDVADKIYELGLGGWWYDVPNPKNMQILNAILQKYVDAGLLTKWSLTQARYADIMATLSSILSASKAFLLTNETTPFASIKSQKIVLSFAPELLTTLQSTYACARGSVSICTTHATTFTSIWRGLSDSVTHTLGKSGFVQTIKTAHNNLAKIFTSQWNPQLKFTTNVSESLSGVGTSLARSWHLVTDLPALTQEIEHTQELAVPQVTLVGAVGSDLFQQMLLDAVQDVFFHQVTDINLATFSEVKDITQWFGLVSQQIYVTQHSLLWGKNQEWSLIKTLWEACELQCGWWTCR